MYENSLRKLGPNVIRTCLEGEQLGMPPAVDPAARGIIFQGPAARFQLTEGALSKGLLVLGGTGSGKSTLLKELLTQVLEQLKLDDRMLVFDPKGEFLRLIDALGYGSRVVLVSSNPDPEDQERTSHWNIYEEILMAADNGEMEVVAQSISRALFAQQIDSSSQPFFGLAAASLFKAIVLHFIRQAQKTGDYSKLNNWELVRYMKSCSTADLHGILDANPDFSYLRSYLGERDKGLTNQAMGILGTMYNMVETNFIGPFAMAGKRKFSASRLAKDRRGKILVLKYNPAHQAALDTVLSLLVSLYIQNALAVGERETTNCWLLLDELALLPSVTNLDQAANFGRSRGVKLIGGLQSFAQLKQKYGDRAIPIASGFNSMVAMRCNDPDSRAYISNRFGDTYALFSYAGQSLQHQGPSITDAMQRSLGVGDSFVDLPGAAPFFFHFTPPAKKPPCL